jgi:hypothetical protein
MSTEIQGWFNGRLPDGWFTGPVEVTVDREEIIVIGTLPAPETDTPAPAAGSAGEAADNTQDEEARQSADDAAASAAAEGRIKRFREDTRGKRVEIAREAERKYGRKVAWGVRCGSVTEVFTTISVPVMTRLRQSERRVLDTLVDAGVARSRSDALAWCVRLTGEHSDAWLAELRDALRRVEEVRAQGPTSR